MFSLIAQLAPFGKIVCSLVQQIHLAIRSIRPHDILLDRLPNSNRLDDFVWLRLVVEPLLWGDYFHNAGLHTVFVDAIHLRTR